MNYKQKAELREMLLEVAKAAPELIGREEWMKRTGKSENAWYWLIRSDKSGMVRRAHSRRDVLVDWQKYQNQYQPS